MPIRLLLLYDVEGWACEGECKSLMAYIDRVAATEFSVQARRCGTVSQRQLQGFDLVFSTIYYHLPEAAHPNSISQVSSYSYWVRKNWEGGWPHLRKWKYMIAKNQDIYQKLVDGDDHPQITKLYHILHPSRWRPLPKSVKDPTFTVGYAGHEQDCKGLPLIREAVDGLDGVRLVTATWESNRIPTAQMPQFYANLDAYICMSRPEQDCGPNPPMEAGLCAKPVITTLVGQIGEMVEDMKTGLVIDRSVSALRAAILTLKNNPELGAALGGAARAHFHRKWCLEVSKTWLDYFRSLL
jgi:hypothetical protein